MAPRVGGYRLSLAIGRGLSTSGGSYSNEGDYFQEDWQGEFWGSNYPRLLSIKVKHDPTNLVTVHKGVGSEGY